MEKNKNNYLKLYTFTDNFEKIKNIKSKLIFGEKKRNTPLISIIIPTYKREILLKETIESVLKQNNDFDDFDIVVVDNSADFSLENKTNQLIKTINSDKILYYINEQNLGQAGNWNRGFELADGKYAALLHDDDLLSPNYFEIVLEDIELAKKYSDNMGCLKGKDILFRDYDVLKTIDISNKKEIKEYKKRHSLYNGIGPTSCPSCGILFNPQAVISVGGFNQDYFPSFDYILGYLLLRNKFKIFYSKSIYGFYRVAVNEALKKENLIEFCKCDYYFREFMYSESIPRRIFGLLFRNVQYKRNINELKRFAQSVNCDISVKELSFAQGYKPTPIQTFLFDILFSFFDFYPHSHNPILYLKKKIKQTIK